MKNERAVKEFLQRTQPLCRTFEWGGFEYNEPEFARRARISLSLDAMTHFILDDSIGTWQLEYHESRSPLYLQINPHPWRSYHPGWGRGIWIQDLGLLKYKPAYDALREVWLHDLKENISFGALRALSRMQDPRTLDDINRRIRNLSLVSLTSQIFDYLEVLENYKCDEAVDIVMDLADMLRSVYRGRMADRNPSFIDTAYNLSEVSSDLRSLMYSLKLIGTEKSLKAMEQILTWFPCDGMIYNAYKDLSESRFKSDEPKIILPEGYEEPMFGADIPIGMG